MIAGCKQDDENPIRLAFRTSQQVYPEWKKKKKKVEKFSLKKAEEKVAKSHDKVFSVKVRCHMEKVLSFNVDKENCN